MKIRIPEIVIDINTQKIQDTAQKAAKTASKTIKNATKVAKETAASAKSKAQQTAKEFKEAAETCSQKAQEASENLKQEYRRVFNKPKLEKLSSEITSLKFEIMKKDVELRRLKESSSQDFASIWYSQKEYVLLQNKLEAKTREYNDFAAKQQICQKLADELNKKGV